VRYKPTKTHMAANDLIRSPLLDAVSIVHGFGHRETSSFPADLTTARQVHGTTAIWPTATGAQAVEADALLTRAGGCIGVVTADCVPLIFANPVAQVAAAVHAGWRGTFAGIVGVAVRELGARGGIEDLLVAIGPSIGPCCYEVSPELAAQFAERLGSSVVVEGGGRVKLDLQQANALQLLASGVPASHIDILRRCTRCEIAPDGGARFHSFRRDGKEAGRQISYVRAPGAGGTS
jgi:YfiH family protein